MYSANYPGDSKYGLCSLDSKSSVWGTNVNSTITFDGVTSTSVSATSILENELWYYPIQINGSATYFVLTILGASNVNLKLANFYANNTFSNLITLSNGQVLNQTANVNKIKFRYIEFLIII